MKKEFPTADDIRVLVKNLLLSLPMTSLPRLETWEQIYVEIVLVLCRCNLTRTARVLGVDREDLVKRQQAYKDRINLYPKHGCSQEGRERLRQKQGGLCKLCQLPKQPLNVDHCHKTKRIRGLLCNACNLALRHVQDDDAFIRKHIEINRFDEWGRRALKYLDGSLS